MEIVSIEKGGMRSEACSSGDKKKPCHSQQGIKKRRKVDSKSDQDSANYFAETYFNRVKNSLKEDGFEKFIKILCDYEGSSVKDEARLYEDISRLFEAEGSTQLSEEFLCFIRPQFAKQISKYEESNALGKVWSTFNGLDSHHFNKMLNILESLRRKPNVKASDVESSLRPLFKTQPNIVSTICQLFPSAKPPTRDVNEYEKVLDIGSDKDLEFEQVYVARGQADRSCPGQSACQCPCHSHSPKPLCSACNVRFINGRIYVQRGKEIRSARVNFSYGVSSEEMQRKLHPSYYAQLQALAESQPKTSPSKGERKDRKNSQSDSTTSTKTDKIQPETKTEPSSENIPPKSDAKSLTLKIDKGGKSGTCSVVCCSVVGAGEEEQVLDEQNGEEQQVFYEQNDEGYLEFFLEESEKEEEELEEMDTTTTLDTDDTEVGDVEPTSSDEHEHEHDHSSPTHRSPGKSNETCIGSSIKSKTLSKRQKR